MTPKEIFYPILRHLLTKGSGILITHGLMTSNDVEPFIGAGLFFIGLAWSFAEKKLAKQNGQPVSTV